MPNPLSSTQLAAYASLFNWRRNFNNAVGKIRTAYGKSDELSPGRGVPAIGRTLVSWDFQVGGATGTTAPMALNFGGGVGRHSHYSERTGTLTFRVVRPMEQEEDWDPDLARAIDQEAAEIEAMFMEALEPFKSSGDYLPMYDVLAIVPLDPDERPDELREVNAVYVRFAVRFCIRQSAWPTVT